MEQVKCANCGKDVIPVNRFNRGWFLFLLFFGVFFGVLYFIYFSYIKKPRKCPVCGDDVYSEGMH